MNESAVRNPHVFMTLCCQHCINTGLMVDAKVVMRWLRVTRPTALKYLDEYTERGYLDRFRTQWRPNTPKFEYRPKKSVFSLYRRGKFRDDYKLFMASL